MKFLKGLSKLLGALFLLFLLFWLTVRVFGLFTLRNYYKNTNKEFMIPAVNDGFVPQGLSYDEKEKMFFTCGYFSDGTSRIYTIDENGKSKEINVKNVKGEQCSDHFGGCSVYKDYLFVTGGDGSSNGRQFLYTFSLEDIYAAANKGSVTAKYESVDIPTGCAFVSVVEDTLYVGEFHHDGSIYMADASHYVRSNHAIMLSYSIGEDGTISKKPKAAYSIPDDVQGMAVDKNGNFYFSCSWVLNPSTIEVYKKVESTDTITIQEDTLPLYVFTNDSKMKTITTSPMLEEIVIVDGRLYTMNESACNKYFFGKLFRGWYCYSFKI